MGYIFSSLLDLEVLKQGMNANKQFFGTAYLGPGMTTEKPKIERPTFTKYPPINDHYILPPAEFDHEYPGKIELTRVDEEGIKTSCKIDQSGGANTKTACSRRWVNNFCEMWVAYDDILNRYRLSYDAVFRHERAHCNGWHHANETVNK